MQFKRHGISIGMERINDDFFLYIKAIGQLTHEDYEHIAPLLEYALGGVKKPQVQLLIDLRDFEGWGMHAVWDEFKLALKHGNEFSHIAVLGDEEWQQIATKVGSWFVSGEVRYFKQQQEAMDWLQETRKRDIGHRESEKELAFSTHS
ncbi:STAS/SEC14 domain-containing protein [Microbulbifer sp. A4B17]|uniref:STAS/SEC14 domain-containing protein n=1 Tax=Microbulbifer sp. A4B17 TaxID=359370 RepID=UPI000D52CF8A|nr:STAS/SEC14 domain-containing protein [Microbulbifer sp. A4B17]AWF82763.1 STAS/SEC14 domain-containing protein [Microbulbifer sp. A4B17]